MTAWNIPLHQSVSDRRLHANDHLNINEKQILCDLLTVTAAFLSWKAFEWVIILK